MGIMMRGRGREPSGGLSEHTGVARFHDCILVLGYIRYHAWHSERCLKYLNMIAFIRQTQLFPMTVAHGVDIYTVNINSDEVFHFPFHFFSFLFFSFLFLLCESLQERTTREANALNSRLIDKPANTITSTLIDQRTGQIIRRIEDMLHDLLLSTTSSHKGHPHRMGNHRQSQRNSLGGRLRRIRNGRNPRIGLPQQFMFGEQAAGMAIRSATQQQQVEDGQTHGIPRRKAPHERLLVLVGELLDVVEVLLVNGVDGGLGVAGDLVEEFRLEEGVVGVFVVEGHGALVGEEDFPFGEVDDVFGAGGRRQQSGGEGFGQGAAGDGDLEGVVALDACLLGLDDVGAEGGGEGVDAGEGVEIGLGLWHFFVG